MRGVTEQLGAFVQIVGGPFGEKATSVLNSITDAIVRLSKSAGDDPKKAETMGEYLGIGAGVTGALLGRKLLRAGSRFLLDVPRAAGPAVAAGGGGLGAALGWLTGGLPLALMLGGDTMQSNQPEINKWRIPKNWDYTLGSGGGFSMMPGSTKGGFVPVPGSLFQGAEVKGSADLHVNVQVEPSDSFISRIVTAIKNEINAFGGGNTPGRGVGTAGSTGLSMPEAVPGP